MRRMGEVWPSRADDATGYAVSSHSSQGFSSDTPLRAMSSVFLVPVKPSRSGDSATARGFGWPSNPRGVVIQVRVVRASSRGDQGIHVGHRIECLKSRGPDAVSYTHLTLPTM